MWVVWVKVTKVMTRFCDLSEPRFEGLLDGLDVLLIKSSGFENY